MIYRRRHLATPSQAFLDQALLDKATPIDLVVLSATVGHAQTRRSIAGWVQLYYIQECSAACKTIVQDNRACTIIDDSRTISDHAGLPQAQ